MTDVFYQEHILEHARDPHNKGRLIDATVVQRELNPSCGDVVIVSLQCDKTGIIRDVVFEGNGCVISQASASLLTDTIKNMTVHEVANLAFEDIQRLLGVAIGQTRRNCALLILRAVQNALAQLPQYYDTDTQ